MTIKIFVSGNSGNKEIVTHQQRIAMILDSLSIEFEPVDIAAPGMDEARDFMRANGKKKEGQRNVLPPQIFNDDKYCGDYDDFDLANEDDELEEFLGIPRKTPKSLPLTSLLNGPEEGKPSQTDNNTKEAQPEQNDVEEKQLENEKAADEQEPEKEAILEDVEPKEEPSALQEEQETTNEGQEEKAEEEDSATAAEREVPEVPETEA